MIEWIKKKDWLVRALKTFAQAFFGTLIPELCVIMTSGLPFDTWGAALIPFVCAGLSSGISAAWNIINEHIKKGEQ